MIDIKEYMQLSQTERQVHLKLEQPCDERGGLSAYFKGLLAYHLDTSIPSGRQIHLCHACHNGACSNVTRLYWGTPKENRMDSIANGAPINPTEAIKRRDGHTDAMKRMGNQNGKGNIGTKKTAAHKEKIALAIRTKYKERVAAK
jgi:hypothetical protein